MKRLISFVVVSLMIVACGKSPTRPSIPPEPPPSDPPASTSFAVSGTVSARAEDGGGPVEGALVSVGDDFGTYASTTTDEEGRYTLQGLVPGTWQLTISKDGFETTTMQIELSEDMAVDVQLTPTAN